MATIPNPMPYPLERLRNQQETAKPPTTKTSLPLRGTPEEQAVRQCLRTLQGLAEWLNAQPDPALELRPGSLRVSLKDILTACKTATRVINEGFEEY